MTKVIRQNSLNHNPKRLNQLKFILVERLRPEFLPRVDIIAERELQNVLETKQGAVYIIPEKLSSSGRNEVVNFKN